MPERVIQLAERVHEACIHWALQILGPLALVLQLLALPVAFLSGAGVGRWAVLPGAYALCALLITLGIGSYAKAVLDATDAGPVRWRAVVVALLAMLGTLSLVGGCGGFWAFTVLALRGRG